MSVFYCSLHIAYFSVKIWGGAQSACCNFWGGTCPIGSSATAYSHIECDLLTCSCVTSLFLAVVNGNFVTHLPILITGLI